MQKFSFVPVHMETARVWLPDQAHDNAVIQISLSPPHEAAQLPARDSTKQMLVSNCGLSLWRVIVITWSYASIWDVPCQHVTFACCCWKPIPRKRGFQGQAGLADYILEFLIGNRRARTNSLLQLYSIAFEEGFLLHKHQHISREMLVAAGIREDPLW